MSQFNINEDAQSGGECSGSQSSLNESQPPPEQSAFPDEDEDTITMLDVIEREDKLEEEASAVLGNSDEKNCTYPRGYIPRQALYSCATCFDENKTTGNKEYAAICLACSLECHENHEVYELYTKRNFRCDCGNSKFKTNFECKLMDKQVTKAALNEKNHYNHNFSGKYCVCDKRYPPDEHDDSAESNDDMLQCIVCEDWYHSKHLNLKEIPGKFEELICGQCVEKLDFVHYYRNVEKTEEAAGEVKSETESVEAEDANNNNDTNDSQAENKDPVRDEVCLLEEFKNKCLGNMGKESRSAIFWASCEWRSKLCRCQKCLLMYKEKECEYLIDEKDTVQYYEAQGKAIAKKTGSPFERGMTALNQMNRAAVVEALHGYDELKADLSDYLRKFADSKKVVREEDIHEFFTQLKSKKRPRLEYEE